MDSPSTTHSSPRDSSDNDTPSLSPSDSASNYGDGEGMEPHPRGLDFMPYVARRTIIENRLNDLQRNSNALSVLFNDEATYQREKSVESSNLQRREWVSRCIAVINEANNLQSDIFSHHLNKHKKNDNLDHVASLELIKNWMEQIASTWSRTHHQLKLYAWFLNDDQAASDSRMLIEYVKRLYCALIQESFWILSQSFVSFSRICSMINMI